MATIVKVPKKKKASTVSSANKKTVKKSPVKIVVSPKKAAGIPVKKTAQKVVAKKKAVNSADKKIAKKTAVRNVAPVKAAVKKVASKVTVAKPVEIIKPSKKKITKDTSTSFPVKPADNAESPTVVIPPLNATVEAATTRPEFITTPFEQPDFKSNRNDGYQSKIQPGNKSKSGIKPSGKKPLW